MAPKQGLKLSVIICLEKLFYKIFFFGDFDMILLWFCYGPGVLHFFLKKSVMAGRIFFVKKIFGHVLEISEWKKT